MVSVEDIKTRMLAELAAYKITTSYPPGLNDLTKELRDDMESTLGPEILSLGLTATKRYLNAMGGQQFRL